MRKLKCIHLRLNMGCCEGSRLDLCQTTFGPGGMECCTGDDSAHENYEIKSENHNSLSWEVGFDLRARTSIPVSPT
jgi:hypothetical protein